MRIIRQSARVRAGKDVEKGKKCRASIISNLLCAFALAYWKAVVLFEMIIFAAALGALSD